MGCIFCKIINSEIPANKIFESESVIAFHDIAPVAPVHILVIPKIHRARIDDFLESEKGFLGDCMFAVQSIVKALKIENGYRLNINSGINACQTVEHLHMHLLAGRNFTWPPG